MEAKRLIKIRQRIRVQPCSFAAEILSLEFYSSHCWSGMKLSSSWCSRSQVRKS